MFKKTSLYFLVFLIAGMSYACNFSLEKRRPESVEKNLPNREVKVVSDIEITNQALKVGKEIVEVLSSALSDSLQANTIGPNCRIYTEALDSLQKQYLVSAARLTAMEKTDSETEKQVFEAYEYNVENGESLGSNIQKENGGAVLLINEPIILNQSMCLSCHGEGSAASSELNQSYKQDAFMGMWSIRISRKEIVKGL